MKAPDIRDVLAFGGLLLLGVGVGLVFLPAALVVVGLVVMCMGLFGVPRV